MKKADARLRRRTTRHQVAAHHLEARVSKGLAVTMPIF
jgi:hypothetical protein